MCVRERKRKRERDGDFPVATEIKLDVFQSNLQKHKNVDYNNLICSNGNNVECKNII